MTHIVHHGGWFFEWSTVSDGPTTYAMTRDEFATYLRNRDGFKALIGLHERLDVAAERGTSSMHLKSARDAVVPNSMGEGGKRAPLKAIVETLVAERPTTAKAPDPQRLATVASDVIEAYAGLLADQSKFETQRTAIEAEHAYRTEVTPETVLWLAEEVMRLRKVAAS